MCEYLTILGNTKCITRWLYWFILSKLVYKKSTSFPKFCIVSLLNFSVWWVFHYNFNLYFPNDYWDWILFHMYFDHYYFLFYKIRQSNYTFECLKLKLQDKTFPFLLIIIWSTLPTIKIKQKKNRILNPYLCTINTYLLMSYCVLGGLWKKKNSRVSSTTRN